MSTRLPPTAYLEVWQKAAEQEIGIAIDVVPEDQKKLEKALYACRAEVGGFEDIMMAQPEPLGQIWLVKKSVELPE